MTLDILTWGLRMGVLTSVLIGLVLLVRRPFVRYFGAEATFLLWSLPILRLIMPDFRLPVKHDITPLQALSFEEIELFMRNSFEAAPNAAPETLPAARPIMTANPVDMTVIILSVWIGIGALWLVYNLVRHYKFTRLLRDVSTLPDKGLIDLADQAQAKMRLKRRVQILIAPKDIGPFVTGIIRPLIIVPHNFTEQYSEQAQLFSLCHEISHIKRADVLWVFILLIFRAIHWYNPLVHYAGRRFRLDQEAACDAHTLSKFRGDGDAYDYAMILMANETSNRGQASHSHQMPALSLALTNLSTNLSNGEPHEN